MIKIKETVNRYARNDLENIPVFPDIKITMDYLLKEYMPTR